MSRLSRRDLLRGGGLVVAAGAVGYAAPRGAVAEPATDAVPTPGPVRPALHGRHQPGVGTARPARVVLSAYDLAPGGSAAALLQGWTRDARALAFPALASRETSARAHAPSDATGLAAAGLDASTLTITVAVGGSLLGRLGMPRPPGLAELPVFPGEQLDRARSDGDLLVQVCADDPVVAFSAARALRRTALAQATPRWQQTGFLSPAAAADSRSAPRNLMGQVDGTDDVVPVEAQDGGAIWVGSAEQPAWLRGGSYLVYRRIRMLLDHWDATAVPAKERVIGRRLSDGAPLGATGEHAPLDLTARTPTGAPVIPADAHVRLAQPAANSGALLHRRGYSYDDGLLPGGSPDAGLLFLAYQSDPRRGFVPIQTRLAAHDALNRFTVHTASGLFAVLPGLRDDRDWYGRALLSRS